MQAITVKRDDLLATLKTNRENHRDTYERAFAAYRDHAIARLEAMLDTAKGGGDIAQSLNLAVPQDHTDDYDRVIALMEWEQNATITLSEQDFARYVLDRWEWSGAFAATNSSYGV